MQSYSSDKKVSIQITIYKPDVRSTDNVMNDNKIMKPINKNKFICSICLNTKQDYKNGECNTRAIKSCPVCQKSCDQCVNAIKSIKENNNNLKFRKTQASDPDVSQGLNLLNEVLAAFHNKKVEGKSEKAKPASYRDVGVCTEDKTKNYQSRLSKSGMFKNVGISTEDLRISKAQSKLSVRSFNYSIDNSNKQMMSKFTVVCYHPSVIRKSSCSEALINHKSSSIPQMKLEELKSSLKEKTKSKDAIEEVNRMFAIVRKSENRGSEETNRPMIRSGPRVLPVVNTKVCEEAWRQNCNKCPCNCVQACLSSGDAIMKTEHCQGNACHENENKPICMVCCHHQKKRDKICEHYRNYNEDFFSESNNCDCY